MLRPADNSITSPIEVEAAESPSITYRSTLVTELADAENEDENNDKSFRPTLILPRTFSCYVLAAQKHHFDKFMQAHPDADSLAQAISTNIHQTTFNVKMPLALVAVSSNRLDHLIRLVATKLDGIYHSGTGRQDGCGQKSISPLIYAVGYSELEPIALWLIQNRIPIIGKEKEILLPATLYRGQASVIEAIYQYEPDLFQVSLYESSSLPLLYALERLVITGDGIALKMLMTLTPNFVTEQANIMLLNFKQNFANQDANLRALFAACISVLISRNLYDKNNTAVGEKIEEINAGIAEVPSHILQYQTTFMLPVKSIKELRSNLAKINKKKKVAKRDLCRLKIPLCMVAAYLDDCNILKLLHKYDPHFDIFSCYTGKSVTTPLLQIAIDQNANRVIEMILGMYDASKPTTLTVENSYGLDALALACLRGRADLISQLCTLCPAFLSKDYKKMPQLERPVTPLSMALERMVATGDRSSFDALLALCKENHMPWLHQQAELLKQPHRGLARKHIKQFELLQKACLAIADEYQLIEKKEAVITTSPEPVKSVKPKKKSLLRYQNLLKMKK